MLPREIGKLKHLESLRVEVNRHCRVDADMAAWLDTPDWNWRDHQECPQRPTFTFGNPEQDRTAQVWKVVSK